MGLERNKDNQEVTPIIIPVYNTDPVVLYLTVAYLRRETKNPIIVVNDGSSEPDTLYALEEIERRGYAVVLHKPNGGKVDALKHGLRYAKEKYNPKCVMIKDDDAIILPTTERSFDETLEEVCHSLNDAFPAAVFPVRDLKLASEKIEARQKDALAEAKEFEKSARSKFGNSVKTLDIILYGKNFLTYMQDFEHIVTSHIVRKLLNEGMHINGTASIWRSGDLEYVLDNHTGEHWGDDLEMTLLLRRRGNGIIFTDKLHSYAELMDNTKSYIRQRMAWIAGSYRLIPRYWREIASNPLYLAYLTIVFFAYMAYLGVVNLNAAFASYFSFPALLALSLYLSKRHLRKEVYRRLSNIKRLYAPIYFQVPFNVLAYYFYALNKDMVAVSVSFTVGLVVSILILIRILHSIMEDVNIMYRDERRLSLRDALLFVGYTIFYVNIIYPLGIYKYVTSLVSKQRTYKIR